MPPDAVRVATFNLRHGRVGAHWPCLPWRLRAGLALCDGADVVGLQEVDRHVFRSWFLDEARLAMRATGATDRVFGAARPFGPGGRYGNALLVRGAITSSTILELPPGGRPERRIAIVAEADIASGPVRVAVTHLQNEHQTALAQLKFVTEHLARLHDASPRRTVLLGDFNLVPSEVAPLTLAAGLDLTGGPNSSGVKNPHQRIDHVAQRGFRVGGVTAPEPPVSDHRPVIATLRTTD